MINNLYKKIKVNFLLGIILVKGENFSIDVIPAHVEDTPWRAGISFENIL
jgi:hypothetical protein